MVKPKAPPKNASKPGDKRFYPTKTKKPGLEQWIPGAPPSARRTHSRAVVAAAACASLSAACFVGPLATHRVACGGSRHWAQRRICNGCERGDGWRAVDERELLNIPALRPPSVFNGVAALPPHRNGAAHGGLSNRGERVRVAELKAIALKKTETFKVPP
jgi:hypothetical protein